MAYIEIVAQGMKYKTRDLAALLLALVKDAPQKEIPNLINKFVDYIKEAHATSLLPRILKTFDALWNREFGIKKALITVAKPMNKEEKREVTRALGEEVELEEKVEPEIIGGIKIMIDDLLVDASLRRRLE